MIVVLLVTVVGPVESYMLLLCYWLQFLGWLKVLCDCCVTSYSL